MKEKIMILSFIIAMAISVPISLAECRLNYMQPKVRGGVYSEIKGTIYVTAFPPEGETITGVTCIISWLGNQEWEMKPVWNETNRYYYTLTRDQELIAKEISRENIFFLLKTEYKTGTYGERCMNIAFFTMSPDGEKYYSPSPTLALLSSPIMIGIIGIVIILIIIITIIILVKKKIIK